LGIEVEEATDGKSGLAIFQKDGDSFVGVLLDFTMPEMDGLETYRRLLAIRPGLPALLVSGYGMDEMRDRLKEYPGMALVQKPFGQKELSKALTGIGWPLSALPSDSMESKRFEEMYLSMLEIWVAESRDAESFYGGLGPLWSQIPGIRFSWAGSLDASSERVFPVAESTTPISPTVRDYFMADDSAWSQGPAGLVVHTGVFSIHNGLEQDVTSAPWLENAVRAGFGSLAVYPLKFDGKVDGTWHLYAFEKGYFTEHRMAFLAEAADLLAKGIHKFRKKQTEDSEKQHE
jgi:CheY-like chemotaxis protein